MSRKARGAGALASFAMMFVMFFAVEGSDANAQTEGAFQAAAAPAVELSLAALAGLPAAGDAGSAIAVVPPVPIGAGSEAASVRFVASPVVQELPRNEALPESLQGEHASLAALVAATPAGGRLGEDLECLAQAIYFEARGEPLAGQLAVAKVVINRSASPQFPDGYCSVVTQRAQFSFVRGGRIPAPKTGSTAWTRAKQIARIAHQELWESDVEDALYFHAEHVRPRWASRKTARATIDSHVFYR